MGIRASVAFERMAPMNFFVRLLFRAPWWLHGALAVEVAYGAWSLNGAVADREADLTAALAAPAPAPINLAEFDADRHVGALDESRVFAQIVTAHNTRLLERTNGVKSKETLMYVLSAPETETLEFVRAVVMVKPSRADDFANWAARQATGAGAQGFIYDLHGAFDAFHDQAEQARNALREQGLSPAPDLQFIDPFLNGREAGLQKAARGAEQAQLFIYGLAAALALISLFKLGARRTPPRSAPARAKTSPVPGAARSSGKIEDASWANPHHTPRPSAPTVPATPAAAAATDTTAHSSARKQTRASALLERQNALKAKQGENQASSLLHTKKRSTLQKARIIRQKAVLSPAARQQIRAKLKQDPFERLAREVNP